MARLLSSFRLKQLHTTCDRDSPVEVGVAMRPVIKAISGGNEAKGKGGAKGNGKGGGGGSEEERQSFHGVWHLPPPVGDWHRPPRVSDSGGVGLQLPAPALPGGQGQTPDPPVDLVVSGDLIVGGDIFFGVADAMGKGGGGGGKANDNDLIIGGEGKGKGGGVIRVKGKGGGKAGLTDDALPEHFLIDMDQYTATRVGWRFERTDESLLKMFDAGVHCRLEETRNILMFSELVKIMAHLNKVRRLLGLSQLTEIPQMDNMLPPPRGVQLSV